MDLYAEIDWSKEGEISEELKRYVKPAADEFAKGLSPDDLRKPYLDTEFNTFLILTGMPQVDQVKLNEKFSKYVNQQILTLKVGDKTIAELMKNEIQPRSWGWKADGKTTDGSMVIDFRDPVTTDKAKQVLDLIKIPPNFVLRAYTVPEYERLLETPDQFKPPVFVDKRELYEWLLDTRRREQVSVHHGGKLQLKWVDHVKKEVTSFFGEDEEIELSPETIRVEWSPRGAYLVEFVATGFWLRGGPNMQRINFYKHNGVKQVSFSPDELYVLSFNGLVTETKDYEGYIVWNVAEVNKIRTFKAMQQDVWGTLKWSPNSKYLARIDNHKIFVYEMPTCDLLIDQNSKDKLRTPIAVPNIQTFDWVQNTNLLICGGYLGRLRQTEANNPAKITLIDIPSRNEHRWKNLTTFQFQDMRFFSSESGLWVGAFMQRLRGKNYDQCVLQIAQIKKRDTIEVYDVDVQNLRPISCVAEPHSARLALICKDEAREGEVAQGLYSFHLYEFDTDAKQLITRKIAIIEKKQSNELLWGKHGHFFALVNKDQDSQHQGILELYFMKNVQRQSGQPTTLATVTPEVCRATDKISYMTDATWDESGKFIFTGSTTTKSYQVWCAYGEQIYRDTIVGSSQFRSIAWRPRPKNILTDKEEREIDKNFKEYKSKYEEEDDRVINSVEHERKEKRKQMEQEFESFIQSRREWWRSTKAKRVQLMGYDDEDTTGWNKIEVVDSEVQVEREQQ